MLALDICSLVQWKPDISLHLSEMGLVYLEEEAQVPLPYPASVKEDLVMQHEC